MGRDPERIGSVFLKGGCGVIGIRIRGMERGRNGKDDHTEKADDRTGTEGRYLRHPNVASARLR